AAYRDRTSPWTSRSFGSKSLSLSRICGYVANPGNISQPRLRTRSHGLTGAVLDDLLLDVLGDLLVPLELHGVARPPRRGGAQIRGVSEHLAQGHEGVHREGIAPRLLALDLAAAAREVADHVAEELLGRHDLNRHHGLEQHGLRLAGGFLHSHRTGDLEGHLR